MYENYFWYSEYQRNDAKKENGTSYTFFYLLFVMGVKGKADVKERGKKSGRNQKAASCH